MASLVVAVGYRSKGLGGDRSMCARLSHDIGGAQLKLYTGRPPGEVAEWLKALAC